MNQQEKDEYTIEEVGKELTALEAHFRGLTAKQVASNPGLCRECSQKHLLHIAALADEGKMFFKADTEFWERLAEWTKGVLRTKSVIDVKIAEQWAIEAREFRLELQKKYMNGGLGESCTCTTGFEACCPRDDARRVDAPCECVTGYEPCCSRRDAN